jgi:hypothetical protein
MRHVDELERAVGELSPDELAEFRRWVVELDARRWDDQIEADVVAGRLDALGQEALADFRQGRTKAL